MKYIAEIIEVNFNDLEFYALEISYNRYMTYGDNFISELINMLEKDYSFKLKEFGAIYINKSSYFEWRHEIVLTKKWLQNQLIPLNLMDKLINTTGAKI